MLKKIFDDQLKAIESYFKHFKKLCEKADFSASGKLSRLARLEYQ